MDPLLLILRIVHVGAAIAWVGGALIGRYFLFPTAEALGPAAVPFMDHLNRQRRIGAYFPIVAVLTILAGAGLYWRDSNGLDIAWITSGPGLAFTIGGLAAIAAFLGGALLIIPSVAAQTAVQNELAATGGGPPTEQQRARLAWAAGRMRLANRIDLPLLLIAVLTMAVGRYL